MENMSGQEALLDMEKYLEEHRRAIRRADAALMLVAIIVAAVVIFIPGVREHTNLAVALAVIASAVLTTIAVFYFPWQRYHPDLFVVIGILAVAMISSLIWATGGRQSPFYLFYFFLVVSAGAYSQTLWTISLIIGLSVLGAASSLIYTDPRDMGSVAFLGVLMVVFITVAIITAVFFRSLAKTAEQLEKRVRELTALNTMFQDYLRQEQARHGEPESVRACLENIRAELARLDKILLRPWP